MPAIRVKENEPPDIALRRFKRACEKSGLLSEINRRKRYEKPTAKRKRKFAAAVKRHLKAVQRKMIPQRGARGKIAKSEKTQTGRGKRT